MSNEIPVVRNIFIGIMITTILVGYDIAHEGTPTYAQENTPVASPTPFLGTSNIKVGEVVYSVTEKKNYITVKVSHYWPDLGGVNCLTFVNGSCISKMANGETWQSGIGKNVIACPKELSFGTRIKILEKIYTCKDRGSAIIKTETGEYWVDMLQKEAIVPYGTELAGEILK